MRLMGVALVYVYKLRMQISKHGETHVLVPPGQVQ